MKFINLFTSFIFLASFSTYAEYKTLTSHHFTPQTEFVGQIGEHCTFTMLSPGIAITAQHCVEDTDQIEVYLNRGRTSSSDIEGQHFVDKVHQVKGKDIAIIEVYPRYERSLSEFPVLSATNTSKLQDEQSNIIFWGYPGSLGSQLAEIEGSVLSTVHAHPSKESFRYEAVTEGGTSGSSVRLKNDSNKIIGIHVTGRRKDSQCGQGWVPECGRAMAFNQKEIDEINELISDNEALAMLEKLEEEEHKDGNGNPICVVPEEDSFGKECDPEELSQIETQHVEEPKLDTYYDSSDEPLGQSYPR